MPLTTSNTNMLLPLALLFGVAYAQESTFQVLSPLKDAAIFAGLDNYTTAGGLMSLGYKNVTWESTGCTGGQCSTAVEENGTSSGILEARGLIQFDLSSLPSDAVIKEVEIMLDVHGRTREGEPDFNMHQITSPWTIDDTSRFGIGSDGAATWKYSSWDTVEWNTPGGDFDDVILSSESNKERENHFFPTTDDLVALVQGWVDGSVENYGVLIRDPEKPPDEEHFKNFFSVTTGGRGSELRVTYTSVSEPVAASPAPTVMMTASPVSVGEIHGSCAEGDGELVTIIASADAMILDGEAEMAASNHYVTIGMTSDGVRRGLYQFDYDGESALCKGTRNPCSSNSGKIPSGAKIVCAELDLMVIGREENIGEDNVLKLHALKESWTISGKTDGSGNNGVQAVPGDVTWTYRKYNSELWSTPGGSFDPTVLTEGIIDEVDDDVLMPSTVALISVVQGHIDGSIANNGFLVIGNEEASVKTQVVVWPVDKARDGRTPYLAVRYTQADPVPSPGPPAEALSEPSSSARMPYKSALVALLVGTSLVMS